MGILAREMALISSMGGDRRQITNGILEWWKNGIVGF